MGDKRIEEQLRGLVRRVAPTATIYFPRRRAAPIGLSWNGRHLRPTGLTLESQIHEVAHLLIAPAHRRSLPEFGLGPDPYRRNEVPCTVSAAEAAREEIDACKLQMLIAAILGLDTTAVTMEYQTVPLSTEDVTILRQRYPGALPEAWWERAALSASA